MLKKIHHLGYAVENITAAARFYKEHFGARVGEPEEVEEHNRRLDKRGKHIADWKKAHGQD